MQRKGTQKRKREEKPVRFFDYSLLFVILFLVMFGLIMIYSTSAYSAELKFGRADFYFRRQLITSCLGLVGMVILSCIDYHIWGKLKGFIYLVSFALCIAVILFGKEVNGSKRWLNVGGFSFQPSEIAKLAILITMAAVVSSIPKKINQLKTVAFMMLLTMPLFGPVAYTNLSNALIIMSIAMFIIFVASEKYMQFVIMIAAVAVAGVLFILKESYRASRITAWLHPETSENGYQTLQSLYAIGSGGFFGKGLGQSLQKLGFVPEAQNDMIFSIICEELGLFGPICVILLFCIMIWRFVVIAMNAKDLFGALLTVGVMGHIATQVILNIAVVTNTIPNTGISLPFISYGGTSVVFLLGEMGIVLNVSRGIKIEEKLE